jgi:hypothetical protein
MHTAETDQLGIVRACAQRAALARNNAVEAREQAERAIHTLPENSRLGCALKTSKQAAKRLQES